MKVMKSIFAAIGVAVVVMYALGMCGVGEFRMCYGRVDTCFEASR
jgi:hypothetical protein